MRKHRVKMGIASLAIAGAGIAGPVAMGGPAHASTVARQHGLVNVVAKNIANHNRFVILKNVPISVAAAACDVNANVLSRELARHSQANCPALSKGVVHTHVIPR